MNNPVDLQQLPKWCHWLAQDKDGRWWAYEVEPLQFDKGWYENELGRNKHVGSDAENPSWHQTLKKIVK